MPGYWHDEQANDVVAYVSPEFVGGVRFIAAALTIADYNKENLDATVWRFVYNHAGAGLSVFVEFACLLKNGGIGRTDTVSTHTASGVEYDTAG